VIAHALYPAAATVLTAARRASLMAFPSPFHLCSHRQPTIGSSLSF
jgi:hypothetical protein